MSYPPPNPYDPGQQQPGYGQPSQPQHFNTDADPYARPDSYGQPSYGQPGYPTNPPMSVAPGSVPPNQGYPTTGQAFQPGQPAPAPPSGSSNTPLIATLIVVVVAIAAGAIIIGMTFGGDEEEDPVIADDATSESASPSEEEETTEDEPSPEETTTDPDEAVYRAPEVDECIENVEEGFYVVPCDSETAYWLVLHIAQSPEDPDPEDEWHAVAANDACEGYEWDQYYFTDTAVSAGREWDPEIDSITAIYCVQRVE
ncbi:hypothetical protein [Glycomyces tenuis]|uniref:hypothetical protein n=1 Tax=Glycomyces tenuis TaxID=58116 RepID=UPI0004282FEF|nr:hypothetical protein [Glycomyces tenuis]